MRSKVAFDSFLGGGEPQPPPLVGDGVEVKDIVDVGGVPDPEGRELRFNIFNDFFLPQ